MYISRFKINNYKSILASPALQFSRGFNVVSGQNNAGKTALLEALGLDFTNKPHRSLSTVSVRGTSPRGGSSAEVSFVVGNAEIRELWRRPGAFSIPKPIIGSDFARDIGFTDELPRSYQRLADSILARDEIEFTLTRNIPAGQGPQWVLSQFPSFSPSYSVQSGGTNAWQHLNVQLSETGNMGFSSWTGAATDFGLQFAQMLPNRIYRFAAERLRVSKGPHGPSHVLARDAANLPEVLGNLNRNPTRFRLLNQELHTVLPQVKCVSVRDVATGQLEVVAWCHEPETQRDDLAVPLDECGTGIGQVLAILCVVLTSEEPQTIIIDEPQSFLHPGAARKLIDFLRHYNKHQYIIATHSATIISAANPSTITLARFEDGKTTLSQLDAETEKGVQVALADLGVRLADSFGADNILWVEGQTEEKCFRMLLEKLLRRRLLGTEIIGVRQTGDFESRDAKRVFEIYRDLTAGSSLLPPAVAFIFDRECRNDASRVELGKLSRGLAKFIPRRMYENYLLNPAAVAHVATNIKDFRPSPISADEIEKFVNARLDDKEYYCDGVVPADRTQRFSTVDGAQILAEAFSFFSETRVKYDKVRHGLLLTERIIAESPADLVVARSSG